MPSKSNAKAKPWVIKYANAEDAATGDSYEVFQFGKTLGRKGYFRIERDKARDMNIVLGGLARKNALLPPIANDAEKMVREAIQSEPKRHRLHVRRLGWLSQHSGFALKRCVLGGVNGVQQLKPPLWVNNRQVGVLKVKGSLDAARQSG